MHSNCAAWQYLCYPLLLFSHFDFQSQIVVIFSLDALTQLHTGSVKLPQKGTTNSTRQKQVSASPNYMQATCIRSLKVVSSKQHAIAAENLIIFSICCQFAKLCYSSYICMLAYLGSYSCQSWLRCLASCSQPMCVVFKQTLRSHKRSIRWGHDLSRILLIVQLRSKCANVTIIH